MARINSLGHRTLWPWVAAWQMGYSITNVMNILSPSYKSVALYCTYNTADRISITFVMEYLICQTLIHDQYLLIYPCLRKESLTCSEILVIGCHLPNGPSERQAYPVHSITSALYHMALAIQQTGYLSLLWWVSHSKQFYRRKDKIILIMQQKRLFCIIFNYIWEYGS